jgi:anti-anti-sigma factor
MQIERIILGAAAVLRLSGDVDADAVPAIRQALLECLTDQADAVVCDLSGVTSAESAGAAVFAAVARGGVPDDRVLLYYPRPEVIEVLREPGARPRPPVYASLEEALDQAEAGARFSRERLRLVNSLEAIPAARRFAGEVCARWFIDHLSETAQLVAAELVADVVLDDPDANWPVELRLELRAAGLVIIAQSGGTGQFTLGLDENEPAERLPEPADDATTEWRVTRRPDGGRLVQCTLRLVP